MESSMTKKQKKEKCEMNKIAKSIDTVRERERERERAIL